MSSVPFETDLYPTVSSSWPTKGKVILGSYTEDSGSADTIILYQAYKDSIANWATVNKTFLGCPDFSLKRMTWVKPNFLWMMFRSGWATKKDQERILAISIKREGFEEILRSAISTRPTDTTLDNEKQPTTEQDVDVRLQWDPDHNPYGDKEERRAVQLGLRGKVLENFLNQWIVDITDITDFVKEQHQFVLAKQLELLRIPVEKVYVIQDEDLRNHVGADL